MSIKKIRTQHQNDVFLHMGEKAFFDNQYAIMPPSIIKGLEVPSDRNGLHDMRLVREMCQRMDGEKIELFNTSTIDMRYAFMDGDKPKFPTKMVSEVYDELIKSQSILDYTDGHKEMGNYLREIHTAGDVDLATRSLNNTTMDPAKIDYGNPMNINNPLLNNAIVKIPNNKTITKTLASGASAIVSDLTGVDVGKALGDGSNAVNQGLNVVDNFLI